MHVVPWARFSLVRSWAVGRGLFVVKEIDARHVLSHSLPMAGDSAHKTNKVGTASITLTPSYTEATITPIVLLLSVHRMCLPVNYCCRDSRYVSYCTKKGRAPAILDVMLPATARDSKARVVRIFPAGGTNVLRATAKQRETWTRTTVRPAFRILHCGLGL